MPASDDPRLKRLRDMIEQATHLRDDAALLLTNSRLSCRPRDAMLPRVVRKTVERVVIGAAMNADSGFNRTKPRQLFSRG